MAFTSLPFFYVVFCINAYKSSARDRQELRVPTNAHTASSCDSHGPPARLREVEVDSSGCTEQSWLEFTNESDGARDSGTSCMDYQFYRLECAKRNSGGGDICL